MGMIDIERRRGGDKLDLAERMVEFRARTRISQGELARQCGLSLQTVNSIENGTQAPTRVTVAKIELVIGKEGGKQDAEVRDS